MLEKERVEYDDSSSNSTNNNGTTFNDVDGGEYGVDDDAYGVVVNESNGVDDGSRFVVG